MFCRPQYVLVPRRDVSKRAPRRHLRCRRAGRPVPPLVISVLASLLERAIVRGERRGSREGEVEMSTQKASRISAFDCDLVLDMSIQSFLERIFRYTGAAPSVYVVAYVYIDRLCQRSPGLRVSRRNAHRLLVAGIMWLPSSNYGNSYFARVGGLPLSELNNWRLHVSLSVFESYCRHLEREVSLGGGYQIERTLRFVCGGEATARERGRTEVDQAAGVL
ncbi:unnamed protein product [Spirodela intermedia]|uniref:Uncharacterized protein n=1 Tax=Spirodela intermedia TaxID=51605 RepID=A0A7I8J9L6_SPIIN|nr:unnamed protein product [Spirodela intermedia]CAA6666794.1 unnamed protein product [Spirodela intermedia]